MNPNRQHTTDRLVDQLRGLRGELQLKSHLASMEVRDAWSDIAPRLDAMVDTLEESAKRGREQSKGLAQEASLRAHLGIMDARDRWGEVARDIDMLLGRLGLASLGTRPVAAFGKHWTERLNEATKRSREEAERLVDRALDELEELIEEARAKTNGKKSA